MCITYVDSQDDSSKEFNIDVSSRKYPPLASIIPTGLIILALGATAALLISGGLTHNSKLMFAAIGPGALGLGALSFIGMKKYSDYINQNKILKLVEDENLQEDIFVGYMNENDKNYRIKEDHS